MNLILACDAAKVLNRDLIDREIKAAQFYLRAKKDCYFFGISAFVQQFLKQPVTQDHLNEAKRVLAARGERDLEFIKGWERIVKDHGGYLPISIRSVEEGLFVPGGEVMLTVECYSSDFIWLLYQLDSLLLRSIWYPSTMLTKMMGIREILDDWKSLSGHDEHKIVYDITGRACPSMSCELASSATKLAFPSFDSISADLFLEQYYERPLRFAPRRYLLEHNVIIGWQSEKDYLKYLEELPDYSDVICIIDTYNVWSCFSLLVCDDIKRLAREKNLTLYICPDSSESVTETIRVVKKMLELYGTKNQEGYKVLPKEYRVVQTGMTEVMASRLSLKCRQMGISSDNFAFMLEDSALQEEVSRNTYQFEYKMCAVKKEAWLNVSKHPGTDHETLSGLQFIGEQTIKYLDGNVINQNKFTQIDTNINNHKYIDV
ncbi:putative Nicotinamide phosphoribosyltransferase [Vibrio coralliirubri]|uniref:nicotinamide phosphoribosyltransferase domain-containing protein n=1 Tax=Vibrio coralliirubri TaxID=1516159 RepID=UPI00062EE802|nr:nicotinamide phosphoribosyltransferase domain-containing protein [Vibrio coralliirubri]CDT54095.1 putative Nicotinamide phosphoribosyltransferase [Vibrio coralliirubri]